MTRLALISTALVLAAPAVAQEQATPPEAPSPKLQSLLQNCDAHKFETTVESVVDGKPHSSKVKMCGTDGQSDADWIGTLKDAVEKLESNSEMPESTRDQIITAVKAEIARLSEEEKKLAATANILPPPPPKSQEALSSDYTVLPPLPSAPAPKVQQPSASSLLPGGDTAIAAAVRPVATPKIVTPAPATAQVAAGPKPRLSFSCVSPDYPGGGPCVTLTRDTILTVKSAEALPAGVALQFLRRGEKRAEVALGSMRKGQTLRFDVPRQVCSGVVTSEVEISILSNGHAVDRQGPYLLRC